MITYDEAEKGREYSLGVFGNINVMVAWYDSPMPRIMLSFKDGHDIVNQCSMYTDGDLEAKWEAFMVDVRSKLAILEITDDPTSSNIEILWNRIQALVWSRNENHIVVE